MLVRIACLIVVAATGLLGTDRRDLSAQQSRGKDGELSPPGGRVKHRAVAEFPLPRERSWFGIGEEVEFWIDPTPEPDAVIVWHVDGSASIYPVTGPATVATVGTPSTWFVVDAGRRDRALPGGKPKPASALELSKWLREQSAGLPKGEREPPELPPRSRTYPKELTDEIWQLDGLRKGRATPFDQLDERGRTLLKKYPGASEQGQIYYMLAHVHAQSGLVLPERVINYSRQALALPVEPLQVPRLYVYWGDALQVVHARAPLVERRKWATVIYLAGLREVLRYPLPARAPELPATGRGLTRELAELKGKEEAFAKVIDLRRRVEFVRAMIEHRDVLTRQLAGLYGRPPVDYDELRELAIGVLREPRHVDRFLRAVKGAPWQE